ncbi:MAG: metal-dependent transcriptional regulator [Dorea sp.]
MHKTESAENYLETILMLSKKLPVVRSIDIATELNYSKPSVSVAMKNLRENECIEVSSAGFITLTEKGLKIANSIYERHEVLSNVLILLGVDPEIAATDACKMEHQLSEESFQALKKHLEIHTK